MTYFSPGARILATELETRLNALQGNESNAPLDHSASPQFQDVNRMREVKMIIKTMTIASPEARISATELETRLNALLGNESKHCLIIPQALNVRMWMECQIFSLSFRIWIFRQMIWKNWKKESGHSFRIWQDLDFSPNDLEEIEERKRNQFQDLEDLDYSPNDLEEC